MLLKPWEFLVLGPLVVDFVGFVNFWSRDPWLLILSSGFWFQAHRFLILLLCKQFALGIFGLGPPWLSMCVSESFRTWARFFFYLFGFSELLVPSPLVLDCHPLDYISLNGVVS